MEPLLSLILLIALVGVLIWALTAFVPMPAAVKQLLIAVAVIGLVVYAIRVLL